MRKDQLNDLFKQLESEMQQYLRERVNESTVKSKTHDIKVIHVNVFGYTELGVIDDRLEFLTKSGYRYSLYSDCDLHDLIDIVNALEDGYPNVINDAPKFQEININFVQP